MAQITIVAIVVIVTIVAIWILRLLRLLFVVIASRFLRLLPFGLLRPASNSSSGQ